MANTAVISRVHLVYGICLPLAVLMGYMLAEPYESSSISVLVLVFSVLSIPLLMRWHHPFLIFSCNAAVYPYFLPGRPTLWIIATAISMFFLILNRSMGRDVRFFRARNLSISLIVLMLIVLVTAYFTGGIGFAYFGGKNAGGKHYLYLLMGIMLYFAMSTISIKPRYAKWAIAAFFLSYLTGLMGYLAIFGGEPFYFLGELFPVEGIMEAQATPDIINTGLVRLGQLSAVSMGIFCFFTCIYGAREVLDLSKPWRIIILVLVGVGATYSGFRSSIILFLMVFFLLFYFEGLFRTRYFLAAIMVFLLGGALMVPFIQRLPLVMQRTLSFLPVDVNPAVRLDADASTVWRLEMWQEVIPTIPQYLIKGKGYMIDAEDNYQLSQAGVHGIAKNYEGAMLSGDYHSGPLSLIIPFGLFGVGAFFWFLAASIKVLRENYKFGDPSLKNINRFLLAYFIARILLYFFIFGSFYGDMSIFAGLVGLSVSLNDGVAKPPEPIPELEPD